MNRKFFIGNYQLDNSRLQKISFFSFINKCFILLFICARAFIHNINNNQDIRLIWGLRNSTPLTSSCFNIPNLELCGIAFLEGFYSKDIILEIVSNIKKNNPNNFQSPIIILLPFYLKLITSFVCIIEVNLTQVKNQLVQNDNLKIYLLSFTLWINVFYILLLFI
uniref:NADH:ubiquinone reductase (H(+)-translocating) n=1 Tax=Glossina morsitans morsitans TaxID=37546 RepID=A0A1B0FBW9_GLOMM